jgi:hypothetical protein
MEVRDMKSKFFDVICEDPLLVFLFVVGCIMDATQTA